MRNLTVVYKNEEKKYQFENLFLTVKESSRVLEIDVYLGNVAPRQFTSLYLPFSDLEKMKNTAGLLVRSMGEDEEDLVIFVD